MAKNRTQVRLTGTGTWTVPAGVTSVSVYSEFNGLNSLTTGTTSFIRNQNGAVYGFGDGLDGALGDNTIIPKSSPVLVVGGYSFITIATTGAGAFTACAAGMEADGRVYTWGSNLSGQLGDGTIIAKSSPVPVVGGHSFVQLSSAYRAFFGLKSDGSVWAWGSNGNGVLGDGTILAKSSPVAVVGGHSFISVSARYTHTLALKSDGSVWAWGRNANGELGDGTVIPKSSPVAVVGGYSFVSISCGYYNSVALTASDTAYTWGNNVSGHLGDGTNIPKSSPVAVAGTYYIGKLGATSLRTIYAVTPGQSIPYKADGLAAQYFGDYVLAADTTGFILEYFT